MRLVAQSLQKAQPRIGGREKNWGGGVAGPELFALLGETDQWNRQARGIQNSGRSRDLPTTTVDDK
jgi:hypothetical protein